MVYSIKGTLIQTEPSVKELILKLGEDENFIIEDINDSAIFITREAAININERIRNVMGENNSTQ
ncbi:TFIIH basal transcription factor complex TTD-A subunit [Pancytospora epiphaga]|nr:TFIIH basal transcription factor complex TTD-A subunit [Pancytospora epiphaga]